MTLAIAAQRIHIADSNGNPIVGAKLYVYTAGTTTLASIYSDEGLSVSMTNPLSGVNASDASGYFPRAYLAAGSYKLRAVTSADVLIWQDDNIDTGLSAGTGALPISRGGTGATTAAAARAALDVPANSELTAITTQIATITTSLAGLVLPPQGYLTLTSATPSILSDVTAATSVYYTPLIGGQIPIYSGSTFTNTAFTELTLALNANHLASTIYDLFVINDGGTIRLVTGPAWNTSTAGSGSRGSGAGTTELEKVLGFYVNKNAMTARYGATTVAVLARQATYVGSIFMDGTNGQVTCHRSYGQSRKWGIWNYYNRKKIYLKAGDATASWSYGTGTFRASNNSTSNSLTVFSGLAEEIYEALAGQNITGTAQLVGFRVGIGWNSTTTASGYTAKSATNQGATEQSASAYHDNVPNLGIDVVTLLELGQTSSDTFLGGEDDSRLSVKWWG